MIRRGGGRRGGGVAAGGRAARAATIVVEVSHLFVCRRCLVAQAVIVCYYAAVACMRLMMVDLLMRLMIMSVFHNHFS